MKKEEYMMIYKDYLKHQAQQALVLVSSANVTFIQSILWDIHLQTK